MSQILLYRSITNLHSLAQHARLELERRQNNPDAEPETPKEEHSLLSNGDLDDTINTNGNSSDADDDASKVMRRSNGLKRKRTEELARKERERVERLAADKVSNEKLKKYKKILKDMEGVNARVKDCEDMIADCDKDLREANCWRTRPMGRDRFWNRYMWFERNGMPFDGIDQSLPHEYGYMNARIWVQGPVDTERDGYIELAEAEMAAYSEEHHMTVPERKKLEEGSTSVHRATEWGYYDDPESIDQLLGWLDERGRREKDLKKEITLWKEDIFGLMRKLKECTDADKAKKEEDGDEPPIARISTRHKTYVDVAASGQRCLKWTNGYALARLGHKHMDVPRPKEKKQKSSTKAQSNHRDSRNGPAKEEPRVVVSKRDRKGPDQKESHRQDQKGEHKGIATQAQLASKVEPRSTRSKKAGK